MFTQWFSHPFFGLTYRLPVTPYVQVKFYLSQLADRNAEVKDTACLCISELSQKVSISAHTRI